MRESQQLQPRGARHTTTVRHTVRVPTRSLLAHSMADPHQPVSASPTAPPLLPTSRPRLTPISRAEEAPPQHIKPLTRVADLQPITPGLQEQLAPKPLRRVRKTSMAEVVAKRLPKAKKRPTSVRTADTATLRKLYKVAAKADLLRRAVETNPPKKRFRWLKRFKRLGPKIFAVIVLLTAGYVFIDGMIAHSSARQQLAEDQQTVALAHQKDATPQQRQAAEGKDEKDLGDALANYTVEASLPRAIIIDKLRIRARLLSLAVNPDGSMQAPINIHDAGWYNGSVKPGQKGAAVVLAHASGPTRKGLFAYLDTLGAGDRITVERGDGSRLAYEVTHKKSVPLDFIDMNEMLTAHASDEGLNLMTCGGRWLAEKKTFDQRVMVFAKRLS